MNKVEQIAAFAEKAGISKVEAEKAYDCLFEVITDALAEGEKVVVTGFGTFEVKSRVPHKGHDPRTKEIIEIPPLKAATFKPGKVLKERVR